MTDLDDLDFEEDIKLDKYELDSQAEKHASLYLKYANLWSDSESDAEEAKSRLDLVRAELYSKIMSEWEELGLSKRPSDAGAENWILQQSDYKEALANYHSENRISKRLKVAKTAFEAKKKMIEVEATLYGTGFWAKPEFSSNTTETLQDIKRGERDRKTQEKVRDSLKKRKRERMEDEM